MVGKELAAKCTRRRVTPIQRQQAEEQETHHAGQVSPGDGQVRQRSDEKRARRRGKEEAKTGSENRGSESGLLTQS